MPSFPFWWVIPVAGVLVFASVAVFAAPQDVHRKIEVQAPSGSTILTLQKLDWGAAFLTVSWHEATPSTSVSLFYCANRTCPYENASALFTGRTQWTEFYGSSGSNGSIPDYWNNQNPLQNTQFIVAATDFGATLTIAVSAVYHNPGPGMSWIEFSGLSWSEAVGAAFGLLLVGIGLFLRVRR